MSLDLQRIFRRVQMAIRPSRTSAAPVETGPVQRVQVRYSDFETHELNSMQQYGVASSPPVGTDVMVINVAGDSANGCVVASNHQSSRPRGMTAGEVRIYNDAGTYIRVRGGEVTIVAATQVTMQTPKLAVSGDIEAAGDVHAGTVSLRQHRHQGTQPGSGQSGTPAA